MIHLICPNPAVDRTLIFERLKFSVPNRPEKVNEIAGGKSFNVAYALNFEDSNLSFTVHTILGGNNGEKVKTKAEKNGILVNAVYIEHETRECNVLVDLERQDVLLSYEKGFDLSDEILEEFTQNTISKINEGDQVVFSGSLMKGMPDDYIVQFIERLNHKKIQLIVDTSGEALREVYQNLIPKVIKINDEEFNELFPRLSCKTVEDFSKALQNEVNPDIPNFIITLGGDGAIGRLNGEIYYYNLTESIKVVNPVASGDFFLGTLVAGLINNTSAEILLKRCIANASTNCLSWIPEIDIDTRDNLLEKIESVKIK